MIRSTKVLLSGVLARSMKFDTIIFIWLILPKCYYSLVRLFNAAAARYKFVLWLVFRCWYYCTFLFTLSTSYFSPVWFIQLRWYYCVDWFSRSSLLLSQIMDHYVQRVLSSWWIHSWAWKLLGLMVHSVEMILLCRLIQYRIRVHIDDICLWSFRIMLYQ